MNGLLDKIYYKSYEDSQDGILVIEQNKLVDCNSSTLKMFGYNNKEELLNTTLSELSPAYQHDGKKSSEKYEDMTNNCLKNGIHRFDWMYLDTYGKSFWVEVVLKKLIIDEKIYVHSTLHDISKRKKLEIELKKQLEENNTYKNAIDRYMIVSKTDLKGRITYANDAFCKISGYSKNRLIGKYHNIIRHPDMPSEFFRDMWETISQGDTWHGNVQNKNKFGQTYHVKTTIIPTYDENEEIYEYVSIREDITELVESRNRAIEDEKSKDLLLSKVSHELRTPLNGIKGFTQMLSKISNTGKASEYIKIISGETDALLELINKLLDVAKFKSEHFELAPTQTNLYLFLAHEIKFFQPMMLDKELVFTPIIDINLPEYLFIDAQRLKQILHNLISNAVKFTPLFGTIVFEVKEENDFIIFSIKDSGIGIMPHMQKKIFKAFTQVDDNLTNQTTGTGLGLNIASSIAKKMGSQIELESESEQGSRFYFQIKPEIVKSNNTISKKLLNVDINIGFLRKDNYNIESFLKKHSIAYNRVIENITENKTSIFIIDDNVSIEKVESIASKELIISTVENVNIENPKIIATSINNYALLYEALYESQTLQYTETKNLDKYDLNILVAEDYETNQVLLQKILENLGTKVTIANNGKEALEIYEKKSFDLILADINMPEMDGFEMAKLLHLIDNKAPIYALTADTSIKSNEKYKSEHFNGIIHKPFAIDELAEILASVSKKEHFEKSVSNKLKLPPEIMNNLLKIYVKNTKKDLLKISEAFDNYDVITMKDIAHKLKGSSGTIFRTKTNQAMVDIEKILKEGNLEQLKSHIDLALEDTQNLEYELTIIS